MDKLEKNCFVIFLRICGFMNLCLFSSPDKMDDGGWDGKWKRGHAPPSLPPLWCLWARHWNRNCSSGAAQWPMCQNIFKLFFIYIFIFLDALLNRKPESREREWRTDMQWRATGWNQTMSCWDRDWAFVLSGAGARYSRWATRVPCQNIFS